MSVFKLLAAKLPERWQSELKRLHFRRQIFGGKFTADEPEYDILSRYISAGDWVVDVGANVGHYTKRFSELVGPTGRVFAFEPVPTTFSLLAANVQLFPSANVSLLNAAASDGTKIVGMSCPQFSTGLTNYYEARLSAPQDSSLSVFTVALDALKLNNKVSLVKIDAEGHESSVLAGMTDLIRQHKPVLIVETSSADVISGIVAVGYRQQRLPGSPNVLFEPIG